MKSHRFPKSFEELEMAAKDELGEEKFRYIAGGAGTGDTLRANIDSFARWRIIPRVLRVSAKPDTSTQLLGSRIPYPLLLAPAGAQRYIHGDGELATAQAAAMLGVPMIVSTYSSLPLEEIAHSMPKPSVWFQLYPSVDKDINISFLHRAEACGTSVLVITVDEAGTYRQYNGPMTFEHDKFGTGMYFSDPVFLEKFGVDPENKREDAIRLWHSVRRAPDFGWKELDALRAQTRLPIILKGIMHPQDASLAIDHSVNGIIVSNHGGRRLSGGAATMDVLPKIKSVVGDKIPILLDGGLRSGADILKAIGLGANAVLLGRPYLYGLALGGKDGIVQVVKNITGELSEAMAATGMRTLAEIDSSILMKVDFTD